MAILVPVEDAPARYRCCGCFHVRTGTLMLAILQIIIHFIVIAILTAAVGRATQFREDVEYAALSISVMSFIQWERFIGTPERLVTSSKEKDLLDRVQTSIGVHANEIERGDVTLVTQRPSPSYIRPRKFFMNAGEEYVAIAVTLLSLLFSIMMLIGTIYARPYYLLPYCCVQFIDLFVTCLSVVGYYTYLPESRNWTKFQLFLSLLVVIAGILLLALKAYMLAMVWLCYKFLLRYAAGHEQTSGFSLVAGSCCPPFSRWGRVGCVQYTSTNSYASVSSVLSESGRITSHRNRSQPSNGRIIFLFRTAPPSSPRTLELSEPCLPPKYEDVLSMPANAYDPPPYESLSRERIHPSIQTSTDPPQFSSTNGEPDNQDPPNHPAS